MRSPREARWRRVERILFPTWLLAAAITMYPSIGEALGLSGTLFTSYAADLAFPPWFYIVCRHRPPNRLARWLGRSPVLLAAGILGIGVLSEIAQLPSLRLLSGTFDPVDVAVYAAGLAACLAVDRPAPPPSEGEPAPRLGPAAADGARLAARHRHLGQEP